MSTEKGVFTKEDAKHHQSSLNLAKWLVSYLPNDVPVIDFGCGNGYYVGYLEMHKFEAIGVDGLQPDVQLCKHFLKKDLTDLIHLPLKGSVISLEVGEHLPKIYQENFTHNLIKHCTKHLVLSWAEIGQPGIGHINCRSQEDVISDIESRGFKLNREATEDARNNIDENCNWFRRTLLIFERV
jgi:hypothetical protein